MVAPPDVVAPIRASRMRRTSWIASGCDCAECPDSKTTNSLGLGRWVEGLSSLLVEMGQDQQEEARRTALHLLVARTFLQSREML